ncbi:protein translocase subunit SecE [Lachnospiraceae bacterium]|nr:preprotein translocase subunit SecE [Eubacterium sp.]MCI9211203.1 preprotein translocase subunit SecE [Eubacterium sp.]GFI25154.1 protein translocase subunit SecE [Lachnospiraceae bacterium]
MADNAKVEKAPKTSWFEGLKAEFGKIAWPAKEPLAKQTAAVIAASVVVGLIITILDTFIQYGIDFLVNL